MKKTTVLQLNRKEKILFLLLVITVLALTPRIAYASQNVNVRDIDYNSAAGNSSANSQTNSSYTNGSNSNTNTVNNTGENTSIQTNTPNTAAQTTASNTEQQAAAKPPIETMSVDAYPKMGFYYDFQDVPGFASYNRISNPQIRAYKLYEVNFFYLNGGFYSYKGAIYDYFNATDSQATNYIKLLKSLGFKSATGFSGFTRFDEFAEQVITEFQTDPFYDKKNQSILLKEDGDQFTWVLVSNSSGPTPESTTWEDAKYAPCKEIRVYSLAPVDVTKTPIIELSASDIAAVKAALAKDTALLKAVKSTTIDLTKISISRLSSILSQKSPTDVVTLLEQNKNITDFGSVIANAASESKPVSADINATPVTADGNIINNTQSYAANNTANTTGTPVTGASAFAANVTNTVVAEKTGIQQNNKAVTTTPPPAASQQPPSTTTGGAQALANNVTQSTQASTTAYAENTLVPLLSRAANTSGIGSGIKYVSLKGKIITYEFASSNAKAAAASYIDLLISNGYKKFASAADTVDFDVNEFITISNGISEQLTSLQNAQIYKKDTTLVYVQATDSKIFISFSAI